MDTDPGTEGLGGMTGGHGATVPATAAGRQAAHTPEPDIGTYRTSDNRSPDLLNRDDYPVWADCRICGNPIKAESFYWPFIHAEEEDT